MEGQAEEGVALLSDAVQGQGEAHELALSEEYVVCTVAEGQFALGHWVSGDGL